MARKKTTTAPKTKRRQAPLDEHAARELELYIENDYELVGAPSSPGKAIERMLLKRIDNGTFDLDASCRAWEHLMEKGAQKYGREFADARDWNKMFSKATREHVARRFAEQFYSDNRKSPERVALEQRVWTRTPSDYRGMVHDRRALLVNRDGATVLVPLHELTQGELEARQ
jgi:hypothetical protein